MFAFFNEVRILQSEGKLHTKLVFRVRILFVISLVLAAVVVYNILFRGADLITSGALGGIGFILGIYVFSRMNIVHWNEDDEIVQTGRMTMVGYATIVLYILFEMSLRTFLKDFSPVSTTAFLLACVCGTLAGRAVGTMIEIHRVYRASR